MRFIVVYTGDVGTAPVVQHGLPDNTRGKCFLSKLDGVGIYKLLYSKIEAGEPLTDVEQMRMMMLPLTEKGPEAKVRMAEDDNYLEKLLMDYRADVLMAK